MFSLSSHQAAKALQDASDSLPDLTLKLNSFTMDQAMAASAMEQVSHRGKLCRVRSDRRVDRYRFSCFTSPAEQKLLLILLSNKAEPPTMLKSLALAMEENVVVGFYPNPDPQVQMSPSVPSLRT